MAISGALLGTLIFLALGVVASIITCFVSKDRRFAFLPANSRANEGIGFM
jgi:hypothetical protein